MIEVSIHREDMQILDLCLYNTWYQNNYTNALQT